MTTMQLEEFADSLIIRQDYHILSIIFIFIIFVVLFEYMKEKGKNRATKDDIASITREVEHVKSGFSRELEPVRSDLARESERLKADLATRGHFSKLRYEREMEIYEEMWPKLSALQEAALSLRPIIETMPVGVTEVQQHNRKLSDFAESHREFAQAVERKRPFFPPDVWNKIISLIRLCAIEGERFRFSDPHSDPIAYSKNAIANAQAIKGEVEGICEAIRDRLSKFDEA